MRTYSQIRQELKERMERAFAVCDRQIQRIEEALSDLGMTMPMSVEEHADLSREQIRCLDQFIFRFSKLQDTMGAKLFRQVLAYLEEDVTTLPMIDILRASWNVMALSTKPMNGLRSGSYATRLPMTILYWRTTP